MDRTMENPEIFSWVGGHWDHSSCEQRGSHGILVRKHDVAGTSTCGISFNCSLLWSHCNMDFCNVANHGSAVESMVATMACGTQMVQRSSTNAGRFAPMTSSSIATSSARSVLAITLMLSSKESRQLAVHTIQCGWWNQLSATGEPIGSTRTCTNLDLT